MFFFFGHFRGIYDSFKYGKSSLVMFTWRWPWTKAKKQKQQKKKKNRNSRVYFLYTMKDYRLLSIIFFFFAGVLKLFLFLQTMPPMFSSRIYIYIYIYIYIKAHTRARARARTHARVCVYVCVLFIDSKEYFQCIAKNYLRLHSIITVLEWVY